MFPLNASKPCATRFAWGLVFYVLLCVTFGICALQSLFENLTSDFRDFRKCSGIFANARNIRRVL